MNGGPGMPMNGGPGMPMNGGPGMPMNGGPGMPMNGGPPRPGQFSSSPMPGQNPGGAPMAGQFGASAPTMLGQTPGGSSMPGQFGSGGQQMQYGSGDGRPNDGVGVGRSSLRRGGNGQYSSQYSSQYDGEGLVQQAERIADALELDPMLPLPSLLSEANEIMGIRSAYEEPLPDVAARLLDELGI